MYGNFLPIDNQFGAIMSHSALVATVCAVVLEHVHLHTHVNIKSVDINPSAISHRSTKQQASNNTQYIMQQIIYSILKFLANRT